MSKKNYKPKKLKLKDSFMLFLIDWKLSNGGK